jgi:hypothetical protein
MEQAPDQALHPGRAHRLHDSLRLPVDGRRLAVRLYWMWRNGCEYSSSLEFGSYTGQLETGNGVK